MNVKEVNKHPEKSIILKNLDGKIHYMDSYQIDIINKNDPSIDYITGLIFLSPPKWMKRLGRLRDLIVKPFGLKTGVFTEPKLPGKSIRYNIGDMIGFFPVIDRSESEIVMAENDKHLYFRVSVLLRNNPDSGSHSIYVTTIVQFHSILGKIYFVPVKPFHKIIVKNILKNLASFTIAQK